MGRIGHHDFLTGIPFLLVVGPHDLDANHLSMSTGSRLKRYTIQAGYNAKIIAQFTHQVESTGNFVLFLERMNGGESVQPAQVFVYLGVVLHRTGAQGIKSFIHMMVQD